MVRYTCPRCGGGEHLAMLYSRVYERDGKSGAFAPLVVKGLRLGYCAGCGSIVPAARKKRAVRRAAGDGAA